MKKITLFWSVLVFFMLILTITMPSTTSINEITYDDILFSDDFNDNIIDRNKWTEIYTNGSWEETNGRAEFQLPESGGTGTRSEGIESTGIQAMVGGDEPWDNKVEVTWRMYPNIGSTSDEGEVIFRITDGEFGITNRNRNNYIEVAYDRVNGVIRYSDSKGNSDEFVGGDEPWDNKLEILGNKYIVTMNMQSVTVDDSIFSTGSITLKVQLYIELGGSSRTNYLRSGSDDIIVKQITAENQPPEKPEPPRGKINGKTGEEYVYYASTTDPEGDDIFYLFDWGNGMTSFIMGPYESGEECNASNIWFEKEDYEVKVQAIDEFGAESEWSDPLIVSMPKTKEISNSPFLNFLENHPHLFPLLRQILGL